MNYYLVTFGIVTDRQADGQTDRQTDGWRMDGQTDGKRHIRAHRALALVGSKTIHWCPYEEGGKEGEKERPVQT